MVKIRLNHFLSILPGVEGVRCCERPGSKPTLAIAHSSFRSFAPLGGDEAQRVLDWLREDAMTAYDHYEAMISQEGQQGLARELARMNLPANVYTQWYWKTDLHNLFHFLRLRADAHAQYEIRVYAETMCRVVRDWVPLAYAAFEDYRLGGVSLSGKAVEVLKRRLAGETVTQETSGMSKGEWREFEGVWGA